MTEHLDNFEVEERKAAFQKFWRDRFLDEVALMRPIYQGRVHEMLKQAFYAGSNFERRRNEPEQLGGII